MKKYIVILSVIFSCLLTTKTFAQISFTNGDHTLDISGCMELYYNNRFLQSSVATDHVGNNLSMPLDKKHNGFSLSNARLKIQGAVGNKYEYKLQVDFAQIGYAASSTATGGASGENPAILDANFTYKGLKWFNIISGYQKLPYSPNASASLTYQPYWQRAEITRGGVFSIRDVGITLTKSAWHQRINLYGGAYSGMGEYILTGITDGNNDSKGTPEYVGRVDVSYPTRYRADNIYDTRNLNVPIFNFGVNARYVNRLNSLVGYDDYDLKNIAGKRTITGLDAAVQYKGFSAQMEMHMIKVVPNNSDTARLLGKNTNYFRAGGSFVQLNYYSKKLKSGVYVRYDEFIPNDLIANNMEQTISFGYNYMINGFRSMIRTQYWYRMDKDNANLLRRDDQFRIGWQYLF